MRHCIEWSDVLSVGIDAPPKLPVELVDAMQRAWASRPWAHLHP